MATATGGSPASRSARAGVRDALAPQDGLFTVTERDPGGDRVALVGALRETLVAPERPEAVTARLADPGVHIVTLTVTEKAYHRAADGGLDIPAVEAAGGTIYHHLAQGPGGAARAGTGRPDAGELRQSRRQRRGAGMRARGMARPGRSGARPLVRSRMRVPGDDGRPDRAGDDRRRSRRRRSGDRPARRGRGGDRALSPMGDRGPVRRSPAAMGARRRAVRGGCRAVRGGEAPDAQRRAFGARLSGAAGGP